MGRKRKGNGPDRGAEPWNRLNLFPLPPSIGDSAVGKPAYPLPATPPLLSLACSEHRVP